MSRELWISDLNLSPVPIWKSENQSRHNPKALAIASVTLNRQIVLDGIELYKGPKGPQIRFPRLAQFPSVFLGSELFRKQLIAKIWQAFLFKGISHDL